MRTRTVLTVVFKGDKAAVLDAFTRISLTAQQAGLSHDCTFDTEVLDDDGNVVDPQALADAAHDLRVARERQP